MGRPEVVYQGIIVANQQTKPRSLVVVLWCLVGLTVLFVLVETVSGMLLMTYYQPTMEHAYNDMLALQDVAMVGILRDLHLRCSYPLCVTLAGTLIAGSALVLGRLRRPNV